MKTIDIVVPCYSEEEVFPLFVQETNAVISTIPSYRFRYIFVNDGSKDKTLEVLKTLASRYMNFKYISFSRNFGKEAAMYAGLRSSAGDFAVIMDADLQHPPRLIADMLKKVEETGCDSVAARRVSRKGEPKIRSVFARLFYKLMNKYCEIEIVDGAVDFRLMSKRMVKAIANMPETQRFSKGIFAWVGFDTQWIEFENVQRLSGETKWTVWGLTKYAIDGFIDFADSPLKFAGAFGGFIAAGSAIYLIVEIIKTIVMGKDTPGYASTICLILFFGGAIIAILGLIGEYIGRMYLEMKRRPVFIAKESNIEEAPKIER